jgi:hypothetical protein
MFKYVSRKVAMPLLLLVFGPLAACASVTRGTQDAWTVTTTPSAAKAETTNGFKCDATPCSIKMSRKSEFTATSTKPGYKQATVQVTHKTANAGAVGMAGNVLVGGLIGIGVDAVSGATQDLTPNPVNVTLEKEDAPVKVEAPQAAPMADTPAAAAMPKEGASPPKDAAPEKTAAIP